MDSVCGASRRSPQQINNGTFKSKQTSTLVCFDLKRFEIRLVIVDDISVYLKCRKIFKELDIYQVKQKQ